MLFTESRPCHRLRSALLFVLLLSAAESGATGHSVRRVPAEWEPQEAIWLQWPGRWEKAHETAFARISNVVARYESLHILYASPKIRDDARAAIAREGGNPDHPNIVWHAIANDNAWMRDNGPVYVMDDGGLRVQNWSFDAWGGAWGPEVSYRLDDRVPLEVAEVLGLPVDSVETVHERGNLEFNGVDTVMLNWSVIGDPRRNEGYTKERAEAELEHSFGVSRVVFIEGVPEGDLTNGHIDGIARFINPTTVVVAHCTGTAQCGTEGDSTAAVFDAAAEAIAAAGFNVIREPVEGTSRYRGSEFDTNYMNWLVGNGFVIGVGFDNPRTDAAAKARLEKYFPGRDVYIIEMLSSWAAGGGVHCHTNDQPALPATAGSGY